MLENIFRLENIILVNIIPIKVTLSLIGASTLCFCSPLPSVLECKTNRLRYIVHSIHLRRSFFNSHTIRYIRIIFFPVFRASSKPSTCYKIDKELLDKYRVV